MGPPLHYPYQKVQENSGQHLDVLMKAANTKDLTPHTLRHNLASILYAAEVDIKEAQSILGHADFSTTANIYTHISRNQVLNAAAKLEQFLQSQS